MRILLSEHRTQIILRGEEENSENSLFFNDEQFSCIKIDDEQNFHPYSIIKKDDNTIELQANYYVGLDWLIEGEKYIIIEPKINKEVSKKFTEILESDEDDNTKKQYYFHEQENIELNYLKMLLEIYTSQIEEKEIGDLVNIYWEATPIKIEQKEDRLTPFLVVQFLSLLKTIIRKGLKKSYYKVQENLTNRIKGKILVGRNIKHNILRNRVGKTFCEYQVFGENNPENKFLKKVFQFAISYVQNNQSFFRNSIKEIEQIINYCRPSFELIDDDLQINSVTKFKYNPFFKEYKEAIRIGDFILKRFSYNISSTAKKEIETPPFWIDMPRLFELYVYHQLLKDNNNDKSKIKFQFGTHGNYLDFLIIDGDNSMVIDAKYKLKYESSQVHSDIRQVSGYARLKKVRQEIGLDYDDDRNINCLIIYPSINSNQTNLSIEKIYENMQPIEAYHKVYKLDIPLPAVPS